MIDTSIRAPGVYFETAKPPEDVETLRTDIAGFVGATERGPVGVATRVAGWRDYMNQFGAETQEHDTPFCIRGYFENGGEVAYVVRTLGAPSDVAAAEWQVDELESGQDPWSPATPLAGGFVSSRYRIEASSPGEWANGLRVSIEYLLQGRNGERELTIKVTPVRGTAEFLRFISPSQLEEQVAEKSTLIRVVPISGFGTSASPNRGPLRVTWRPIELRGGAELAADSDRYLSDVALLLADPEVALIVMPDMYELPNPYLLLSRVAARADLSLDRQVIVSLPEADDQVIEAFQWVQLRREELGLRSARTI